MYPALLPAPQPPRSAPPITVEAGAILRDLFDGCAPCESLIEALLDRLEALS